MNEEIHSEVNGARLKRIAVALLIAIAFALTVVAQSDTNNSSLIKRGDFPGFYVLAEIFQRDQMSNIYDPELQREIENKAWPSFGGGFYMSVYPPYDALLLAPLGLLTPQHAQIVFTLLMLASYLACCLLVAKINSSFAENFFANCIFLFCFPPLFYAICGAQNTALSMLCFAGMLYYSGKGNNFCAGLCAGLWLFKPQFAVFFPIIFLCSAAWSALLGFAIPAALYYLIAATYNGALWPLGWIEALLKFSKENFIANAPQNASLIGTSKAILAGSLLVYAATAAAFFLGYLIIRQALRSPKALHSVLLLFGPLLVLISPQTLFYDLGIAMVTLMACLDFRKSSSYGTLLAIILISMPIVYYREYLPVPMFFLLPLFIYMQTKKLVFQKSVNN